MKKHYTQRGFAKVTFTDQNDDDCSIQESSLATEDCLWLGLESANPQILCAHAARNGLVSTAQTGWQPYAIPDDVLLSTRMHLNEQQVLELVKVLVGWLESKELTCDSQPEAQEGGEQ